LRLTEGSLCSPSISCRKCFEKKATDVFTLEAADVGVMEHLVIGHDNSGFAPAWYLEAAKVEHLTTGQTLAFEIKQWFDQSYGDGLTERTLYQQQQQQDEGKGVTVPAPGAEPKHLGVAWEVGLVTGKTLGAGTDADVWLQLRGQINTWGPSVLPAGREAFEAGRSDRFQLQTPELGELVEVVVGHDGTGMGAAWYLESLDLINMSTGKLCIE
jgi:hypothetical protein